MYLMVRTEENKVVRYLLYLCQKKGTGQETVKFSVQNTHSWARVLPLVKNASGKRGKIPLFVFKHYIRKLPLI